MCRRLGQVFSRPTCSLCAGALLSQKPALSELAAEVFQQIVCQSGSRPHISCNNGMPHANAKARTQCLSTTNECTCQSETLLPDSLLLPHTERPAQVCQVLSYCLIQDSLREFNSPRTSLCSLSFSLSFGWGRRVVSSLLLRGACTTLSTAIGGDRPDAWALFHLFLNILPSSLSCQ